jgi:DNA-binding Lrp family transcriptional regulator
VSSKSSLDKIDKHIIDLLRKDPEITHSKIADIIGRNQPAIGNRIKKLEKKRAIKLSSRSKCEKI